MQSGLLLAALLFFKGGAAEDTRVADVFTAGDESHWVIEVGGKPIGQHWSTYAGAVDLLGVQTHHFIAGVRLTQQTAIGATELHSNGELWTDEFGRPLRWLQRVEVAGTISSVDLTIKDGKGSAHVTQGPSQSDVEIAVPPGAFLLANNYVSHVELITALAPPTVETPRKLDLVSPDVLKVVPFELRHQGNFVFEAGKEGDEKEIEKEIIGEKYRDSLGEVSKVLPDGKLVELDVPAANLKFRRSDEPFEKVVVPAPPVARTDFEREEIVAKHDGVAIAGTITRKKGTSGRRPALFFVSGSGLQDREGLSGGVDLGTHELLDRLTDEGFLVLRVDDRGVGKSKGAIEGLTFDDLVADARACVDFLLARPDVDPKRVAVIGHSEGGETAPLLAKERPLAAIVLMAAPGRGMREILRDQKRQGLEDAQVAPALIESELEVHRKFLELACSDAEIDPEDVRADYRSALKERPWFKSHAHCDPIARVLEVRCPVLIVQGGKDFQVSPQKDAQALATALTKAKHPDATLRLFPDLDHLFKKCPGEKSSVSDYLKPRPVDPEFLDAVSAWLKKRLKP